MASKMKNKRLTANPFTCDQQQGERNGGARGKGIDAKKNPKIISDSIKELSKQGIHNTMVESV